MKNAQTKFRIAGSKETIDSAPSPTWVEVHDEPSYEALIRVLFRTSDDGAEVSR